MGFTFADAGFGASQCEQNVNSKKSFVKIYRKKPSFQEKRDLYQSTERSFLVKTKIDTEACNDAPYIKGSRRVRGRAANMCRM